MNKETLVWTVLLILITVVIAFLGSAIANLFR
jgi:hypothetical protein